MAVEKMTKKQKFEMLKALVADNAMLVEFIDHEIELLDKKKSNSNAKANEKMEQAVEVVFKALEKAGVAVQASELIAKGGLDMLANESGVVSTQKVSAMLKKLVDGGRVEKFTDKKKTFFRVKAE
ncbi:MAG: hypothetical protein IJ301_02255 [Clostridia bacterium]|nr:hypothetical protein [Clostridia bacterium]